MTRIAIVIAASTLTACSALDVNNPTIIDDTTLDDAAGANALWTTARWRFAATTALAADRSGRFADEFFVDADPAFPDNPDVYVDRRDRTHVETALGGAYVQPYNEWQLTRRDASLAIDRVRAYGQPGARGAQLGELFAIRGFAALRLAEDVCPGFPLNEFVDFAPVYQPPMSTDSALMRAVVQFDSALAYAGDSARVLDLARVGKARALLDLGAYEAAATVAQTVSPGYEGTVVPPTSELFFQSGFSTESVSDREGTNGLDFVTAADPRVVVVPYTHVQFGDTTAERYAVAKYPAKNSPVVVASEVEAKLIIAESQLQPASNPSGPWLETLNALRRTVALPDTTDPGTADARVNLLFRERAFWLFATGHRLADLRRLVRQYGRDPETVFPTGAYRTGDQYATGTSLPFPTSTERVGNPSVTGCTGP